MTVDALFEALDIGADGRLDRRELRIGAIRLGWQWPQAPLFAVLDRLMVANSLSKSDFVSVLQQIEHDRLGYFGEVLRRATQPEGLPRDRALLVIDPQRSFTSGAWMRSFGPKAEIEVKPLVRAFQACAELIRSGPDAEIVFTRCPFPPNSYEWDERLDPLLAEDQHYFVKPGNSALWPPTNGFMEWLDRRVERGTKTLVIGGCTLNSCVRVSAIETRRLLAQRPVKVVVDLSLCGARASNSTPSPLFRGRSSIEAAIEEMISEGVEVEERVTWS
jgi:nicotinamidase-related amidase